jgi:serine/threonine-protein kinase
MVSHDSKSLVKECPSRESLLAYAAGKLPTELLGELSTHIENCVLCQSSLEQVQPELTDDSLVGKLRQCVAATTISDAATVLRLRSEQESAIKLPRSFGKYELLEEIGRGGMGVVYLARQAGLKRFVAVKMILAGVSASPEERKRFATEGEAMGRLQHPNFVLVHEIDEIDGQFYLSMEYLPGGSLSGKIAGGRMPQSEAAKLVRTLARAMHVAHQQRIIHRDLKPSNVLLAADGSPKISDFGLAKLQDSEVAQTATASVLGTPSYMAPEQAQPRAGVIGPLTDVYSLGAILYEALTGHPPHQAPTKLETLELVRTQDPAAPHFYRPEVSPNLEAVCRKCLAREPADRYSSAEALADDLGRWLAGEPTLARPPRWYARVWRWLPKRAVAAVFLTLAFAAALFFLPRLIWPQPSPPEADDALKAIEAKLRKGQSVTLIDETGEPAWSQFHTGTDFSETSLADDGTFRINTWDVACLELLRDPQVERYQIHAELRNDAVDEKVAAAAEVGLFCAMRDYPLPDSRAYFFVCLGFNDIVDLPTAFKGLKFSPKVEPPPAPTGNTVYVGPQIRWKNEKGMQDDRSGEVKPNVFQCATDGKTWRKITLAVSPEGISSYWSDSPTGDARLLATLTAKSMNEKTKAGLARKLKINNHLGNVPGAINPEFTPRAPCGLFVNHSKVSFRNVVIEPILE